MYLIRAGWIGRGNVGLVEEGSSYREAIASLSMVRSVKDGIGEYGMENGLEPRRYRWGMFRLIGGLLRPQPRLRDGPDMAILAARDNGRSEGIGS